MFDYPPPDWDYWRNIPTLTLFEAVALSLNIEPRFFAEHPAHPPSTISPITALVRPAVFHERLDLTQRCIGETLPAAKPRDGVEHVTLTEFAVWATGLGWGCRRSCFNSERPCSPVAKPKLRRQPIALVLPAGPQAGT
jgi:hypothetical protein